MGGIFSAVRPVFSQNAFQGLNVAISVRGGRSYVDVMKANLQTIQIQVSPRVQSSA